MQKPALEGMSTKALGHQPREEPQVLRSEMSYQLKRYGQQYQTHWQARVCPAMGKSELGLEEEGPDLSNSSGGGWGAAVCLGLGYNVQRFPTLDQNQGCNDFFCSIACLLLGFYQLPTYF